MASENIITGMAAIDYAAANGLTLNKYSDPTEEARVGLSVREARSIANEDPSLIWVERETLTEAQAARLDAGLSPKA